MYLLISSRSVVSFFDFLISPPKGLKSLRARRIMFPLSLSIKLSHSFFYGATGELISLAKKDTINVDY